MLEYNHEKNTKDITIFSFCYLQKGILKKIGVKNWQLYILKAFYPECFKREKIAAVITQNPSISSILAMSFSEEKQAWVLPPRINKLHSQFSPLKKTHLNVEKQAFPSSYILTIYPFSILLQKFFIIIQANSNFLLCEDTYESHI